MTIETRLTSAQLAPIHTKLTAMASDLAGLGGSMAWAARRNLSIAVDRLAPGITIKRLSTVMNDIQAVLDILRTMDILYSNSHAGTCDDAVEALAMCSYLCETHDDCATPVGDPYDCNDYGDDTLCDSHAINEVYINFDTGVINGECFGCNAADMAGALERLARDLRLMDDTPSYIEYDEGKIHSG